RCYTTKPVVQKPFSFCNECCKHLHKAIRETCFKNSPCYAPERHLETEICPLPPLLPSIFKYPKGFHILGTVTHSPICSVNFYKPGICFSGRKPFHFQLHWHFVAVY